MFRDGDGAVPAPDAAVRQILGFFLEHIVTTYCGLQVYDRVAEAFFCG